MAERLSLEHLTNEEMERRDCKHDSPGPFSVIGEQKRWLIEAHAALRKTREERDDLSATIGDMGDALQQGEQRALDKQLTINAMLKQKEADRAHIRKAEQRAEALRNELRELLYEIAAARTGHSQMGNVHMPHIRVSEVARLHGVLKGKP